MKSNMASKMAAKIGKYLKFSIMTLPEITMAVDFFIWFNAASIMGVYLENEYFTWY